MIVSSGSASLRIQLLLLLVTSLPHPTSHVYISCLLLIVSMSALTSLSFMMSSTITVSVFFALTMSIALSPRVRQCEKISPGEIKARSGFMSLIPQAIISFLLFLISLSLLFLILILILIPHLDFILIPFPIHKLNHFFLPM